MNLSHSTLFSEYEPVTRPLPSYLQTQRVQRDAHPWTRLVQNFQFNIEPPLQNCSPLRTLKKRDWGSTHHPKHCIPALCKRFDGWSFSAGPANLNLEIAIHNTVETSHPRNMFFHIFYLSIWILYPLYQVTNAHSVMRAQSSVILQGLESALLSCASPLAYPAAMFLERRGNIHTLPFKHSEYIIVRLI